MSHYETGANLERSRSSACSYRNREQRKGARLPGCPMRFSEASGRPFAVAAVTYERRPIKTGLLWRILQACAKAIVKPEMDP